MRSTTLALAAIFLLATSPAFAGGIELGGYGGYGWPGDYGIFHPEKHALFGGRIGFFLTDNWSLEFSAQRLGTKTEFDDSLGFAPADVHLSALRGNILYNFGHWGAGVRPFLTVGAGREKFSVDPYGPAVGPLNPSYESGKFGWNAGAGLRFALGRTVNLRLEGRYVHTKLGDPYDETEKNWEATAGLSLLFGHHHHEEEHAEAAAAAPNQPPTVTCTADRAQILPGETATIHVTAADPEGGPLTYAWTSSSGHVAGTGDAATFDFANATPPASATVTVRVTDDHGNSATSDCTIALAAPPPPPKAEAVSCVSGGFPRNLSRLNNVDKACLDDVAQRLSADPRARVVVIGYSDAGEKTAGIAQKRADAVQDYLTRERNIDKSRIETRSAGNTKPLGSAEQNRRVEVWFVPEGASVPTQ
ncbi:MAG: outer membrane beta-barrel protein [Bacteroidota bacterium]